MENARYVEMTQGPLRPLICKMALPGVVSMVVTAVYNMADTYFVGFISTGATGAIGIVFSLMALIMATGLFFGQGSGNYISRALGAQDEAGARVMLTTGLFSCFIAGSLLAIGGLVLLEPLARLLGATETILPHACAYMRYILLGAPFMACSLTLNNQFRFQGNPRSGMIGIASGAVLNMALDPLFILGFNMGTAGAGLATMLSQVFSFGLLLYGCTRSGNIRIRLQDFRPTLARYAEMVRGGFPSFARQLLSAGATIALNRAAGTYGDAAIAAMAIVSRIMSFANSAILGFGQGYQPVCGFNFGARRYARVLEGFSFCVKVAVAVLCCACAAGFVFARPLVSLFRDDPAVREIGVRALRLQCLCFPCMGYVMILTMLFQNIGQAGKAGILSLVRQGVFFLPALLILKPLVGLWGIQLAQPIADLLTFALALPMGIRAVRGLRRMAAQA